MISAGYKRDLIWGYLAQTLNIGLGLILLPLILHYLSVKDVGLWFVFVTLGNLALLLESGFQPTVARNISYVYGGVADLSKVGLQVSTGGPPSQELLANLLNAARKMYANIALVITLILIVVGSYYISTLLESDSDKDYVYLAWIAYAAGSSINLYYGYLTAILHGRNDITSANKVVVISRIFQILLSSVLVWNGLGLLGLGIAALVTTIASRVLASYYVYSKQYPEMKAGIYSLEESKRLYGVMWHNALRFSAVLLGGFLIWRANILVASSLLGLEAAAAYGLAVNLFSLILTIATVPFSQYLPRLNILRAQGNRESLYSAFGKLVAGAILVYVVASLMLLALGNTILTLIGSTTFLPIDSILIAMIIVFLLEVNHGTCANFIATENRIPFVAAATVTGVIIVAGSLILAPIFGLWGLVISQGVFQAIYNNWKWPHEVAKGFNTTYPRLVYDGFLSLKNLAFSKNTCA